MLDDDHRRGFGERTGDFQRGIEVENIVIGKFFSVKLFGIRDASLGAERVAIEGRGLVRILAIAQILQFAEADTEGVGIRFKILAEPRRDGRVIGGGVGDDFSREMLADAEFGVVIEGRIKQRFEGLVVALLGNHSHIAEVLRRRAEQRNAADINLLDDI